MEGNELKDHVILIVDDEPETVEVTAMFLDLYGATTLKAHHGREALDKIGEKTPTVVLLDLQMPVMDGWETLKAIRASDETAYLPVVAFTANVTSGIKYKALISGFNGYIPKPMHPPTILFEIQRAMEAAAEAKSKGEVPGSRGEDGEGAPAPSGAPSPAKPSGTSSSSNDKTKAAEQTQAVKPDGKPAEKQKEGATDDAKSQEAPKRPGFLGGLFGGRKDQD
ncbi:MAG: response regulator [Chloroflexi bacterium]|nr:response regulator [Chloroflexota bacterium]